MTIATLRPAEVHERALNDALATEADTLRRHAEQRPNHTAIIFEGRRLTYGEMNRRASQVANGMRALETEPQRPIALLAKNSEQFFEVLYGVVKARHFAMPLNWRLSARELAEILLDSTARVLVIGSEFVDLLPDLARLGVELAHVLVLGAPSNDGSHASRRGYAGWRDLQSDADPRVDVRPDDIFMQLYTSGTTGKPKGVQLSHRASMQMRVVETSAGASWSDWGAEDVSIVAMPNFHVGGSSWAIQWFARGATCVVQVQVDPRAMLESIGRDSVTHIFAVPTVLDMMLADPSCAGCDFSSLKLIHYGGAPITPTLLTRCIATFGVSFVQYYGMTETNGVVCVLEPHDHDLSRPELLKSCGRPYPAVDLRVMDSDGCEVATGAVGEICIDTPALMSSYWRLPDATRQAMFGRHYRSGDAGYKNPDGYVFLVDRVKDMIVSGGENIYPIEVERALAEHPMVSDCAVIGIPDPMWGEAVRAVVVRGDPSLDAASLTAFLRERIARYKIPKTIEFVESLPRNAGGKVLKRVLRDQYGKHA